MLLWIESENLKVYKKYLTNDTIRTNDCMNDMLRYQLMEADVEKLIMDAMFIEKVMPATSLLA
jgi:hypothetical protein